MTNQYIYGDYEPTAEENRVIQRQRRNIPQVKSKLRGKMIHVPEVIYNCSGINVLGKRIKSLIFTTDVAIIKNNNAQATIAVYPFTPQLAVLEAILDTSSVPVFTGVGGGPTPINRVLAMATQAELKGAYGVVLNAPTKMEVIRAVADEIDIALIVTVASIDDNYMEKVENGANILNVSGGKQTAEMVRRIRKDLGEDFPIIATGGKTEESIMETILAGANAITYTPPTTAEIFQEVMESYRVKIED